MPAAAWGWEITPDEFASWIIERTPELIVLNKPPRVVCHPSRHGPWSSLIGAAREYLGVECLHMPSRLDRETSGVLVFAFEREAGRRLQNAVLRGDVQKTYIAILEGELQSSITVDQPIGRDEHAEFFSRQAVLANGQHAITDFVPVNYAGGHTLVRIHPRTGRRHQIRVHAAWLGYPVAGDKLYGRDPALLLRLMANGFREAAVASLAVPRHALHAAEVVYGQERFKAPVSSDMLELWARLTSGTHSAESSGR